MPGRASLLARDYAYAARSRLHHVVTGWRVERFATGTANPVLLIPGVFETWEYLLPIARRLHDAGHPVHVLRDLGYNRLPIADSAEHGTAYLARADLTDVTLVAHSKGGLIGKHMMAFGDPEGRIRRLIAVCSPFSGSALAAFAPGRALREFRPARGAVAALARERSVNDRITSVYGEFDQYIPGHGSHLPGAENIRLPLVGHFRVLADPRVLDVIEERA